MNHVLGRGRWVSLIVGLLATVMLGSMLAPAQAAPRAPAPTDRVVVKNEFGKVRSHFEEQVGRKTVTGNFTPRVFRVNNAGDLIVVGKVRAQLERPNGKVVRQAVDRQRLTVLNAGGAPTAADAARAAATCDILNLVLGPLDLNLLGLEIQLEQVVLDIIARTGAGNLLGNLLCAVAGLLDNGGLLAEVSNLLNAILAILRL